MVNASPAKPKAAPEATDKTATSPRRLLSSVAPARLRRIGGSNSDNYNVHVANAVTATVWYAADISKERRLALIGAIGTAMAAFNPTDEIEGMIAAQAVAMHHASMECSRRAMMPDQEFDDAREYRKAAANASRAFVELVTALDRKRGKGGQQKVTVEHVHVHAGGQAIVGAVVPAVAGERGGGAPKKLRDRPHAPPAALEHDASTGPVVSPLRSADTHRQSLPFASDGERPVPDARRR